MRVQYVSMGNEAAKFHEYVQYDLSVMSQT